MFALRFLGLLVVFSVVYPQVALVADRAIMNALSATAAIVQTILGLVGQDASQQGRVVTCGGFSIEIIVECIGIYETLLLWAAILAYRSSWRARLIGLGAGAVLIYLTNVLRLCVLSIIGAYWPNFFDTAHEIVWQATMIICVALMWLIWIRVLVGGIGAKALAGVST